MNSDNSKLMPAVAEDLVASAASFWSPRDQLDARAADACALRGRRLVEEAFGDADKQS